MRRHLTDCTVPLEDRFRGDSALSRRKAFTGRPLRPRADAVIAEPGFSRAVAIPVETDEECPFRFSSIAPWIRFPKSSLPPVVSTSGDDLASTSGRRVG